MRKYRYKMVQDPTNPKANKKGQVYQHIVIMEKHLGRYLQKGEVVHHIDKDETNNDISNLKLCNSYKEHKKEHYPDLDNRICLLCRSNKTCIKIRKSKYKVPCWYKYKNGFICEKCNVREYKRRNNKKYSDKDLLKHKLQMELLKQFIN